ncbi:hypothetical protein Ddc_10945 [Ditylenchus destructor]|nr:hypothetical protein Ddc_10945 [Ditylenchus destructor]
MLEVFQQQNQFIEQLQDQIETVMSRPSAEDIERKRSLVFIGLPEPQKTAENAQITDNNEPQMHKERKPSDLVALDKAQVRNILDSLNITAEPTTVYRLGKETMQNGEKRQHPRLVKVVLPASGYQRATLAAFSKNRAQVRSLPDATQC